MVILLHPDKTQQAIDWTHPTTLYHLHAIYARRAPPSFSFVFMILKSRMELEIYAHFLNFRLRMRNFIPTSKAFLTMKVFPPKVVMFLLMQKENAYPNDHRESYCTMSLTLYCADVALI